MTHIHTEILFIAALSIGVFALPSVRRLLSVPSKILLAAGFGAALVSVAVGVPGSGWPSSADDPVLNGFSVGGSGFVGNDEAEEIPESAEPAVSTADRPVFDPGVLLRDFVAHLRSDGGMIDSRFIARHGIEAVDLGSESVTSRVIRDGSVSSEDLAERLSIETLEAGSLTVDDRFNADGGLAVVGNFSSTGGLSLGGALRFIDASVPVETADRLYDVGGTLYWSGSPVGGAAVGTWDTDGTDTWRSSGNVGIGTESPSYALDVVGAVRASSGIVGNVTGTISSLGNHTTDDLAEGSARRYYTDARARSAFSSSVAGISYASGTGILSLASGYAIPTTASIANWNQAYGWGNHATAGYLASSSYTASDVLSKLLTVDGTTSGLDADTLDGHDTAYFYAASNPAGYITDGNIGWDNTYGFITDPNDSVSGSELDGVFSMNGILRRTASGTYSSVTDHSTDWNQAYGWGNHASAGYLAASSYTASDVLSKLLTVDGTTSGLDADTLDGHDTAYFYAASNPAGYITDGNIGWDNTYGFLTSYSETDPVFAASSASGITGANIANWNQAYGWGNHASAGYLTGITGQSIKNLSDVYSSMTPADGQVLTYDTTNGWQAETLSVGISVGDTIGSATAGSVFFAGASGVLAQDNANLFWDSANHRLGLGTTGPAGILDVRGGTAAAGIDGADINLYAQGGGAGTTRGGSIYLRAGSGSSGWPNGSVEIDNASAFVVVRNGNDQYVSSDSGWSAYPSVNTVLRNDYNFDGTTALNIFNVRNANANYQYGYFGAVSTSGSSNYAPALVWGQSTGSLSYQERMRIDGNGNVGIGTASPTDRLTVGGNMSIAGNIVPAVDDTYALGSPTRMWKDFYVGPGSIYVNGQKVLQTDLSDSVVVSADTAQNLVLKTTGGGNVEINPAVGGGQLLIKSNINLTGGKYFDTTDHTPVNFTYGIATNVLAGTGALTLSAGGTDENITLTPSGTGRTIAHGIFGLDASSYLNFGSTYGSSGYGFRDDGGVLKYKNASGTWTAFSDASVIDHGGLSGLLDDDHAQYALLAGRSGGQTLVGGSGVTDVLKLQGTSGNGTLTSPAIRMLVGNNGATTALTVLNNGNVGIGTTSPGYALDIAGTASTSGIRSNVGIDLNPVVKPTFSAGNLALTAGGSNLGIGAYYYSVTYLTALGETNTSGAFSITTDASNRKVTVTVPVSSDPRVTGRRIYRTAVGGASFNSKVLTTISDNTTASYVDDIPDGSLTGNTDYFRSNTTSKYVMVNGSSVMSFSPSNEGNLFFGYNTGNATLSSGRNVGIGQNVLRSLTTGSSNMALGVNAFQSLTTGSNNIAIGYSAGNALTTGGGNVAVGHVTLYGNKTGTNNTAIGSLAMFSNYPGYEYNHSNNTAIGANALYAIQTGGSNTAIGVQALYTNTTGSGNNAIGENAGRYLASGSTGNETGSNSLFIGSDTRANGAGQTNQIVIGASAIGLGSNTVVLGNDSIVSTALKGNVGIGTTSPSYLLHVSRSTDGDVAGFTDSNGTCTINPTSTALICSSDRSLKKDIVSLSPTQSLDLITSLDPVSFRWKKESESDPSHTGLIAQDVQDVLPSLVSTGPDGKLAVNYLGLVPYAVSAIQGQQEEIDSLSFRLDTLDLSTGKTATTLGGLQSSIDAQLDIVGDALSTLGKDADSLDGRLSALDSRVLSIESDITDLVSTTNGQDTRIGDLEEDMALLRDRNAVLFDFFQTFEMDRFVSTDAFGDVVVPGKLGIGIDGAVPTTDLDVDGTMRLRKNDEEPYTCDDGHDSAIALTSLYTTCICRADTGWVSGGDGVTSCVWSTEDEERSEIPDDSGEETETGDEPEV